MIQAEKKAEKLKKKRSLDEFDAFMAKANDIEEAEGKAARDAYEKEYQADKTAREARKKMDVESLKRKLLDVGQDPYSEVDAERQVFLLEHDIDLDKISGTPQNEQMIKNFQKRGKNVATYKSQRYIVACQVADLKARGIDPIEHFSQQDVMEKTRAIYRMDDRVAEKVAKQYEGLMAEYGGRLTPAKEGEVPFVYSADTAAAAGVVASASSSTASSGASLKEEKAVAKAQRAAEKEAARNEKMEARAQSKAERAEAKAQVKADRAAAKEERLAEKAAAGAVAAAAATSAGASASVVSMADDDVAATANGDVFAAAGNNAVEKSSVEEAAISADTQQTSASKANDVISSIKTYATPRNVATVVIGGGVAAYGFNYYQENSASSQSEREQALKLILGDDEDDDYEDDDDEDDDEDG